MRKIGIMGGTFDPIHFGHMEMGRAAKRACDLNEVIFMPSGNPAYKTEKKKVSDKEDRLMMTALSVQDMEGFTVSDLECKREGNTYTADTLKELRALYPEDELYFIVGADSLDYMDKWVRPQEIFDLATIVSIGRIGFSREKDEKKKEELESMFNAKIIFAEMEPVDISSTEIRERIRKGEKTGLFITDSVLQYIEEKHLYD